MIQLDLSIIIVSWNAKNHLVNCLNSLVENQDGYTQEIIVIDNDSSDGSPEKIEKEFPQVKLIRNQENLGFSKANNIGIKKSVGRYICLVNSDIIVLDGCIDGIIKFMDGNPSVGIVGPRVLNPDRSLQVSCRHFPSIWNKLCQAVGLNKIFPKSPFFSDWFMDYWNHDSIRGIDVLSGCFWMVRKEALVDVGLLDESFFIYGEDIDWCKRFHQKNWGVMFYPRAEAIHFGGASSNNAPIRFYIEMQKADLQYWRKHHGFSAQAIYAVIIVIRHLLRIVFGSVKYVFYPPQRKLISFKLQRSAACIRWILNFKKWMKFTESKQ